MSKRKISYQTSDGKWIEVVVYDIIDPMDTSEAEIKKLQKDNIALEEEVVMLQGNRMTYKIWKRFSHTKLARIVDDLRVEKQKLKTDLDYHMELLKDCDKLLHKKRLKFSAITAENKVLRGTVPEGHVVIVIDSLKFDLATSKKQNIDVLDLIQNYGGIDGSHHKQWLLDEIVKVLADSYQEWVVKYEAGEDGPKTCIWDEGIAP